jgi:hypothetical protein
MSEDHQRGPLKATPEQIERWSLFANASLSQWLQKIEIAMQERHRQELKKNQSDALKNRHRYETECFAELADTKKGELEARIQEALRTGILPMPENSPTHSKEDIDLWAQTEREQLAAVHAKNLDDYRDELARADDPLPEGKKNSTADIEDKIKALQQDQYLEYDHLEHVIVIAYMKGRIPDLRPPTHDRDASMER